MSYIATILIQMQDKLCLRTQTYANVCKVSHFFVAHSSESIDGCLFDTYPHIRLACLHRYLHFYMCVTAHNVIVAY